MRPVPQAGCSQQPGAGTFMMAKSRLSGSVSAPPGRKQVHLEEASVGLGLAFLLHFSLALLLLRALSVFPSKEAEVALMQVVTLSHSAGGREGWLRTLLLMTGPAATPMPGPAVACVTWWR